MFDLEIVLEQRLEALKGHYQRKPAKDEVLLNDTSKEYIVSSLTQAGILDKKGNVRQLIASD